jgi:hypothetical protein
MKCKSCESPLGSSAKFCSECGKLVEILNEQPLVTPLFIPRGKPDVGDIFYEKSKKFFGIGAKTEEPAELSDNSSSAIQSFAGDAGVSPPKTYWAEITVAISIVALFVIPITLSLFGSGDTSGGGQSSYYEAGYDAAAREIGKNPDRFSAYNQCNLMTNVYLSNPNQERPSSSELDDYVRGCMAYVTN